SVTSLAGSTSSGPATNPTKPSLRSIARTASHTTFEEPAMTTRTLDAAVTAKWESGEYGRSEAHVAVAPEDESLQLDSDLAMKLVSIRLPVPLIEALKAIAGHHG